MIYKTGTMQQKGNHDVMAAVSDVGSKNISRFQSETLNRMSLYAILYRPRLQLMSPECAAVESS
jgi:hypothetical protein